MKRVAVTGMGMIDNLGNSPEMCFQNLCTTDAPSQGFYQGELTLPENMPPTRKMPPGSEYAFHVVEQSLQDIPRSSNCFLTYLSSTIAEESMSELQWQFRNNIRKIKPSIIRNANRFCVLDYLTQTYDIQGGGVSHQAECVSGMYAIHHGMTEVDRNDYVICMGIEVMTPLRYWLMGRLGTLGNSLPYSRHRSGIRIEQSAHSLIIEDEEKAKARGAKIYGYLHRPHVASDGASAKYTDPSPIAFRKTMTSALEEVDLEDIAFVNAHGTGTPLGDPNEHALISELAPDTTITSYKGKIGHSLNCTTIAEVIYTLMALNKGIIPRTHTEDCEFDNIALDNIFTDKKKALKNSLAFGGKAGSMIIEVD